MFIIEIQIMILVFYNYLGVDEIDINEYLNYSNTPYEPTDEDIVRLSSEDSIKVWLGKNGRGKGTKRAATTSAETLHPSGSRFWRKLGMITLISWQRKLLGK